MGMTREKAILHFERYVNDDCYTVEHREACKMAVAALREQEEQENLKGVDFDTVRKWIPASEPPKDSEHVLVCTKHRKPFKARYYPDRKRWDVSGSVVITHWMPLPDPPREDKR